MKIFGKCPISKLNSGLVICIAKNFIWTTLKAIFSRFWFLCNSQLFKWFYHLSQIWSYPNSLEMSVYTLPAAHSPARDVGSTCGWRWGCWWLPPPRGVCFEVPGRSSPARSPNLLSSYQSASSSPWIYARHWKYRWISIIWGVEWIQSCWFGGFNVGKKWHFLVNCSYSSSFRVNTRSSCAYFNKISLKY